MKARDIIYSAFRLLQVTSQGEQTTSASMEDEALLALQLLVASWSAREILAFKTFEETFALVPGKGSYTIGVNGDFNTIAPEKIRNAYVSFGTPSIDKLLTAISQKDYFSIRLKTTSVIPTVFYFEYGSPVGNITFYPVPSTGMSVTLSMYRNYSIIDNASIDTEIDLPSPYLSALKYNLAVELAPEYSIEVPQAVSALATQTLENIIMLSRKQTPMAVFEPITRFDPLRGIYGPGWWWDGEY